MFSEDSLKNIQRKQVPVCKFQLTKNTEMTSYLINLKLRQKGLEYEFHSSFNKANWFIYWKSTTYAKIDVSLDDLARSDIDLTNWVSRGACGAVGFTRIWRNLTNWPR